MTDRKKPVFAIFGKYSIYDKGEGKRGRFQARVWDKETKARTNESFSTLAEAKAWADIQSAKFELGQDRAGAITITAKREEYLLWLRGQGRSKAYVEQTSRFLGQVVAAGIDNMKSKSIVRDAANFMDGLRNRVRHGHPQELKPATRSRLVSQLRCFGNWLTNPVRRYLITNPFKGVACPRIPKQMLPVFTVTECRLLCTDRALADEEGLHWALRLYTGLRAEEATWLRWEHIMFDQRRIRVKKADDLDTCEAAALARPDRKNAHIGKTLKGEKDRLAILQDELAEILLKRRGEPQQYLFSAAMRARNPSTERRKYVKHLMDLGIPVDGRVPHRLRATCASILLAGGLDVYQLLEHLGHSEMDTTKKYVRNAGLFREQCHTWGGKFFFRTPCHSGATGAGNQGQAGADTTGMDSAPADAEEELFILLPSTSDLLAQAGVDGRHTCAGPIENTPSITSGNGANGYQSQKSGSTLKLEEYPEDVPLT